jgi:nucleotide-binding universal stress UspA family protein
MAAPDTRPVLVAYDGSAEAQAAIREAAALFRGRPLVVVTVFEANLGMALMATRDPMMGVGLPPDYETERAVERVERRHATDVAEAGAELARGLGATAEAHAVPDEANVGETLAEIADERDAAVLVVGSRGLGRIKGRLLGSTSQGLLHRTRRPVLVVRTPE